MALASMGNAARWILCGILFVTLVLQQARNVLTSLRRNASALSNTSLWQNDHQQQNENQPLESTTPSSSWMGNYWIPPPDQPLYSGLDFQTSFPPQQSVLMIGDVWLRHSYAMLYAILNNTENPSNVRVITIKDAVDYALKNPSAQCSRHSNRTHCWALPSAASMEQKHEFSSYDFVQADCLSHAVRVLESSMAIENYKLVVLGVGTGCTETTESQSFVALRTRLLHMLSNNNGNVTVVWRTTPNLVEAVPRGSDAWEAVLTEDHSAFNSEIRKAIQGLPLVVLDWAATLQPKARIRPLPVPQNLVPPTSQPAQLALLQQFLHSMIIRKATDGLTMRKIEIR